ncbi:hypothetical protein AX16_007051 [Volvariella volvacea WC 439]|nr:hypothetical protein AX16_007051 [Volvariella volvacea WC 439]
MSTSTPTTLANAPIDIVESIAKHLDLSTLKALRLASHDIHHQFSSVALRNIAFRINGRGENVQRLFEACSRPLPALYQYGRHLTVMTNGWYVARYVDEEGVQGLCRTLGKLKNLTSFEITWESGYDDKEDTTLRIHEIQERVIDAIYEATEGKLVKLVINPWKEKGYGLPKRLKEFRGLRELEFTMDKYGWGCRALDRFGERSTWYNETESHQCIPPSYKDTLQSMISKNPGLDIFKLHQGCAVDFHEANVLFIHSGARALAMRSLFIKGIRFSRVISAKDSPFAHLRHLEVLTPYAILPLDNLWKSLEVIGAPLETLKTLQVTLSLCSYLASYSGLQQLIIMELDDVPECTHPNVTSAFFNDSLPQHSSSLTKLHISLRTDISHLMGWSFTPELWMPAMRSLARLKSLHLYPGEVERFLPRREPNSDETEDYDDSDEIDTSAYSAALVQAYQEVIAHVESLPRLQTLEIIWPDKTWGCGTGRMRWLNGCKRTLSQVVKNLRCTNGVPKELVLLSGRHDARRMGDGSGWCFAKNMPDRPKKRGLGADIDQD